MIGAKVEGTDPVTGENQQLIRSTRLDQVLYLSPYVCLCYHALLQLIGSDVPTSAAPVTYFCMPHNTAAKKSA